jgi:hypothetical protein
MADALQMDWLDLLETHRPDYLERAREVARKLLETRDSVTVNDVRAVCPPPPEYDGRIMGAIFKHKDFEATGENVTSSRSTCHHREIKQFTLSSFYRVHQSLGRNA